MNLHKIQYIPLSSITAYLAGAVVGDGYLTNAVKSQIRDPSPDYRIVIEVLEPAYGARLLSLMKEVVETRSTLKSTKVRGNRVSLSKVLLRNKSLFYFFTADMGIPKGAKSSRVAIPRAILSASVRIKRAFLAGYFDTDGGFRGGTIGFTTASKELQSGISSLLTEFTVDHRTEQWLNRKYHRVFYGIRIKKIQIDRFLSLLPLQNLEKRKRILERFCAAVPERSNGLGLGDKSFRLRDQVA